ncbi:hypothetical protein P154DRAFT_532452 [Amniculicola lignicola CBS 123094]|uniref:Uncharacterized protein n=1 Tax=Amniculicola lignicola CBS 123094 TaxID=1392246 RepID=A0A6A5WNQ9_9PLEO|nr:hypothetical protein P154DRAFT_532452 [Amniculicola lignicola CBS 123094]
MYNSRELWSNTAKSSVENSQTCSSLSSPIFAPAFSEDDSDSDSERDDISNRKLRRRDHIFPAVARAENITHFHHSATLFKMATLIDPMFNPAFIGKGMAQEVLRLFFSRNCFDICHSYGASDPGTLHEFLGEDRFDIGVVPRDWIRNLRIRIKPDYACPGLPELETRPMNRRLRAILSLDAIESMNLEIMVVSNWSAWSKVMLKAEKIKFRLFLDRLRGPVRELIRTREKVTVVYLDTQNNYVCRDISRLFAGDDENCAGGVEALFHGARYGYYVDRDI